MAERQGCATQNITKPQLALNDSIFYSNKVYKFHNLGRLHLHLLMRRRPQSGRRLADRPQIPRAGHFRERLARTLGDLRQRLKET
jgi:hypothetical protein